MTLAPIILFVYNRPWHTQQALETLMLNELADLSTLYVYCDGPKKNATEAEKQNIELVRNVIKQKDWCKEVIVIERDINLGLANSVIQGVTQVIEKHGRVIVLEDDIITGCYFLKFMNDSLNTYKNDSNVFGISGYKYPSISRIENSTYFLPIACSWSYATWSDRWCEVNFDGKQLLKKVDDSNLKNKLNFGGYPFYEMLQNQINGKDDSWAIRFYVSMFLCDAVFLFPNISLVANNGFDASGTHCNEDDFFSSIKLSNDKLNIVKQDFRLNDDIVKLVRQSFEAQYLKNNGNSSKKINLVKKGKQILRKVLRK